MTFEKVHRLIKKGDVINLRNALENGLDPNLANQFGATILMLAALQGNSLVGRLLIEYGANVDLMNNHGDTALSLAAFGSASFFKMLLMKGSSFECGPKGMSLDVYLEWVCSFYPERTNKMQRYLLNEREHRAKRDRVIDRLLG
jgi:hypothetical protein